MFFNSAEVELLTRQRKITKNFGKPIIYDIFVEILKISIL